MANTLKFGNSEWYGSEGNILAYNDLGGNYKPLPFSFSRGSSATRVNQQGLIETVQANNARVDYLDNTNGAMLLEPQRTNYLPNSDNGSSYTVFSATKTLNQVISLDGTLNSFTLEGNGDYNQVIGETGSITLPSAGDYTFSVFAKKGNNNFIYLFFNQFNGSSNGEAYFDLENGTTSSSYGKIENYGNGWYKCSVVATVVGSDLSGWVGFRVSYTSSNFFFPTANDANGKNAHFYGFQVEKGSYATSYIPTQGTAQTRLAELQSANNILSHTISIGANEDFAIYCEGSFKEFGDMLLGGGQVGSDSTSKSYLWIVNSTTLRITGDGEVLMASCSPELSTNTNYKILVKRNGNVIDFFINGVKLNTTQGAPNTSFTIRSLGWSYSYSVYTTSGKIKNITTYNTSLTDSQAIALTQV